MFSLIGYYPFSYPSSIPAFLASFSLLSGINMEYSILLFSIFEGLFSVLISYLIADKIQPKSLSKWILIFLISFSPGLLYFTLWTISTRGFVSILFLFVLYLLIELKNFNFVTLKYRKLFCIFLIMLIFLLFTHRIGILMIIICIFFFIIQFIFNYEKKIRRNKKSYIIIFCIITVTMLFTMIFFDFIFKDLWNYFKSGRIADLNTYYLLILSYGFFNGLCIFLIPFGFIYTIIKKHEFGFFISIIIILLIPLYFIPVYTTILSYILFPFLMFFGILLLNNFINFGKKKLSSIKRGFVLLKIILVICLLLINIIFAFSVQYIHFGLGGKSNEIEERYLEQDTYDAGIWLKYNNDPFNRNTIILLTPTNRIMQSSGDVSILDGGIFLLSESRIDKEELHVKKSDFNIFIPEEGLFKTEKNYYIFDIYSWTLEDPKAQDIINKYNISVVCINNNILELNNISSNAVFPVFFKSVDIQCYTIFENDRFTYYHIGGLN